MICQKIISQKNKKNFKHIKISKKRKKRSIEFREMFEQCLFANVRRTNGCLISFLKYAHLADYNTLLALLQLHFSMSVSKSVKIWKQLLGWSPYFLAESRCHRNLIDTCLGADSTWKPLFSSLNNNNYPSSSATVEWSSVKFRSYPVLSYFAKLSTDDVHFFGLSSHGPHVLNCVFSSARHVCPTCTVTLISVFRDTYNSLYPFRRSKTSRNRTVHACCDR